MCPIDAPYAYVQQISANHAIFTQGFHQADKQQTKQEQNQALLKFLSELLHAINSELYPQALKAVDFLTEKEAETLKAQMPSVQNLQKMKQEIETDLQKNLIAVERELLQNLLKFTENNLQFVEELETIAQALSEEESAAEIENAEKIIAQNRADGSPRIKGWDNIAKLFD